MNGIPLSMFSIFVSTMNVSSKRLLAGMKRSKTCLRTDRPFPFATLILKTKVGDSSSRSFSDSASLDGACVQQCKSYTFSKFYKFVQHSAAFFSFKVVVRGKTSAGNSLVFCWPFSFVSVCWSFRAIWTLVSEWGDFLAYKIARVCPVYVFSVSVA